MQRFVLDHERLEEVRAGKAWKYRMQGLCIPSLEEREQAFVRAMVKGVVDGLKLALPICDRELVEAVFGLGDGVSGKTVTQLARERKCSRQKLYRRLAVVLAALRKLCEE